MKKQSIFANAGLPRCTPKESAPRNDDKWVILKLNDYKFEFKGKMQSVIISQIRLLDAKRLYNKMGTVSDADFSEIKKEAKDLIFED